MPPRKVAAKLGPANPDVSAVIAAARKPQPQMKAAADLKPGDWLARDDSLPRNAAEVLDVHPYRDAMGDEVVFVTYLELGELGPNAEHLNAHYQVQLATADDVEQIKAQARGVRAAMQLRQLADLITRLELPMPRYFSTIEVNIKLEDLGLVEKASEALGIGVRVDSAGRHEVLWPGTAERINAHGNEVRASWFTYPEHYKARDVDEEQTGEPVPDDVEGYANEQRAGEIHQVSAPPADGPQ